VRHGDRGAAGRGSVGGGVSGRLVDLMSWKIEALSIFRSLRTKPRGGGELAFFFSRSVLLTRSSLASEPD
jgi:hypothetical protein